MNILITSAGRRVSLVRAFQKELREFYPNAKVIATDLNPLFAPACNIADLSIPVSKVTENNYIEQILNICLNHDIKLIIPTIDTELLVLSENCGVFEKIGVKIIVSSNALVRTCRDKRKMNTFFNINNIETPREYLGKDYVLPLFVKPFDGSRSIDTHIILENSELQNQFLDNPKYMILEYISPQEFDEFTVDLYYGKDNCIKCAVPRKRIEVRSGEVSKGITAKNILIKYIKEKLYKIDGAIGCLTAQFFLKKDNSRILGIEINPRFGGGYPLSYLAGANYPQWIIKEYLLSQNLGYFEDWEDNLLMLRYDNEIIVHNAKY